MVSTAVAEPRKPPNLFGGCMEATLCYVLRIIADECRVIGMENGNEFIYDVQQLIGDELRKYHEDKIKRDQGEKPNPKPGIKQEMKPVMKKRIPQALLQQYMQLN